MRKNYKSSLNFNIQALLVSLFCSFLCVLFVHSLPYYCTPKHTYTATVTEMDSYVSEGGCTYLVSTNLVDSSETRIFQFTDSLFHFPYDSKDLHSSIEVGKTYTFTVYGYNSTKFLRRYETIVSVKEP